jgi:O-succinylbenzoate synthase
VTTAEKTFDRIEVVSLPLKVGFRGLIRREIVLVKGERWAEFSPFVEYPDPESVNWLKATMEWAFGTLPEPKRKRVGINATLPAISPDQVQEVLRDFGDFRTVKIKVAEKGQSSIEDVARIQRVADLYPTVQIRLDANTGWSVSETIEFSRLLQEKKFNIEYLEQPVATIDELSELREKFHNLEIDFAIAADESIRKAQDPLELIRRGAADVLVLKVAPLGGIKPALEIAQASNLGIVVSSALESSIGIQAGLHFAASLENLEFDCGLGTSLLFESDIVDNPLIPEKGFIELRDVEPSELLIQKMRVSEERREFWLKRLERVLALLEA